MGRGAKSGRSIASIVCIVVLAFCTSDLAVAQDYAGSFLVNPFGAIAMPTGRFAETDPEADPPKSGHNTGYSLGADFGFLVTSGLAIGVGVRMASFDIDFGPEIEAQFPAKTAKTDVLMAELWGRWFLPRGFERWRPYLIGAVGIGRPKGTVEYDAPFIITLPDNGGTIELQRLESTISTSVMVTGGVGVFIPISPAVGLNLEPRYTLLDTKGAERTDEYETSDGQITEAKDTARSNTNWWEVRGGIFISL